jgi:transmembrane sensor
LPDILNMDQKHFRGILKKYLQGEATPEEEKMIDSWYTDMGKDSHSFIDSPEESELENKYWSAITDHIRHSKEAAKNRTLIPWKSLGIAASVLVAMFSYLYMTFYMSGNENPMALQDQNKLKWDQISNSGKSQQIVILPDESKVILEPNSQLKFSSAFDESERAVYLKGEAFFEVTRSVTRPFLVHTSNLTTKVLGTSFTIKAFEEEKNVIVAVKTGKVSVYTNKKENTKTDEIILTPNQKIVFDKAENKVSRMIVESPQAILPAAEVRKMRFEAAPVSEIFHAIEKVYGVELVFDEDKFSGCTLTSVISDGDLYNRLDIICKAIGATYILEENKILISGAGCNYQ